MDKNPLTLVLLGHPNHGKTTLAEALIRIQSHAGLHPSVSSVGDPETLHVEFETLQRRYHLIDPPGGEQADAVFAAAAQADAAVLVVSAADGVMPGSRQDLLLAQQAGVSQLVIFVSKTDLLDDPELLDIVGLEAVELAKQWGFERRVPVVRASARAAIEASPSRKTPPSWRKLDALLQTLDRRIPTPERAADAPLRLLVGDAREVAGASVLGGQVVAGTVSIGDPIELIGFGIREPYTCRGIDYFGRQLKEARAGMRIGLQLDVVGLSDLVRPGMICAEPGTCGDVRELRTRLSLLGPRHGFDDRPDSAQGIETLQFVDVLLGGGCVAAELRPLGGANTHAGRDTPVVITLVEPLPAGGRPGFVVVQDSRIEAVGTIPAHRDTARGRPGPTRGSSPRPSVQTSLASPAQQNEVPEVVSRTAAIEPSWDDFDEDDIILN